MGGLVAWAIDGPTAGAVAGVLSYGLSLASLGPARAGTKEKKRPGRVFQVSLLVSLVVLSLLSLLIGIFDALPAVIHAQAGDTLGPDLALAAALLFSMLFGAAAYGAFRVIRWRTRGGSPMLDQLEAEYVAK
jgi:hypothetical protein